MSDEKHSQVHEEFKAEEARAEGIKVGLSRIVDRLPFKCNAELDRRTVVTELHKKFVESGLQIAVSDRGWIIGTDKSGNQLDMTEQVSEALLTDKALVDQESVASAVESGALGVLAKSDLRTVQQKVRFVAKFGEDAFAKLPMTRQPKVTDDIGAMTGKEYLSLPRSKRAEISGIVGEKGVSEILRRK
jgi:hypothetical protein